MRESIREDLQQLQALGWKHERWVRKEGNYLAHRRPLREPPEARGEVEPWSELRWVLEGDLLSQGLTVAERYLLMAVYRSGNAKQAAKVTRIPYRTLLEVLSEMKEKLCNLARRGSSFGPPSTG